MPFKKLVKKVILIVLAVVLLFGFVSIFQGSDEDKIQKLANNYAEAINDNSVKKLAKCIDPEKREMFTEQINKSAEFWDWANLKDMVNVPEGKELRIGVTNIVIEGNTATADFAYYFDSSKMWTESVDLIKVKSKWYFAEM